MAHKLLTIFIVIAGLTTVSMYAYGAKPQVPHQDIKLSPDVLNLLRAEMNEIAGGVQGIALSLATADWKSIQETGMKIRNSYIMEKKLTPAQAKELQQALSAQFKQLDAEFHQRAEKLEMAAAAHDPELTLFHYSRLVESCVRCHSTFATKRFPGFVAPTAPGHHH